jgi:hypothetical protein
VSCDEDLCFDRQPKILGEVILDLARATFFTARRLRGSLLFEPRVCFSLCDDGEDLDCVSVTS